MKKMLKFPILFFFIVTFFYAGIGLTNHNQAFAQGECISTHVYHYGGHDYSRSYDYSKPYTRAAYFASSRTAGHMGVSDIGNYIHYTDNYPSMSPSWAVSAYGWSDSFWNHYIDSNWENRTIEDADSYRPYQRGSNWQAYSVWGTKRFKDEAGNYYRYRRAVSVERSRHDIDATAPHQNVSPTSQGWTGGNIGVNVSMSDGGCWATNVNFDHWRYNVHTGNYWPSSGWSGWIGSPSNYTITLGNQGVYYISVDAVDKVGNESGYTYGPYEIDKSNPYGTASLSPSGWTKGNVTINFSSSDTGGSGYYETKLPNGTYTSDSTPSYTVSSNGTYWFEVIDHVGNTYWRGITVSNIDRTAPYASASLSPSGWTNGNVTINLSTSDSGGSGYYETKLPNGSYTSDSTPSYTVSSNGSYWFEVIDHAGNTYWKEVTVSNIDQTPPTGSLSQTPTGWTNGNVTLNLTNISDVGTGYSRTRLPNGVYTTSTTPSYVVSSNGTYSFILYDRAGNSTTKSLTILNIDKTPPNAITSQTPTGWTSGGVTLSLSNITDSGGSGYDHVRLPNGNFVTSTSASYVTKTNGTFSFVLFDRAGNSTTKTFNVSNIDHTPPKLAITASTMNWTNNAVTITATATDPAGVEEIILPTGNVINSSSVTFTVKSNGAYMFQAIDKLGNKTTQSFNVLNIDLLKPVLGIQEINRNSSRVNLSLNYSDQ